MTAGRVKTNDEQGCACTSDMPDHGHNLLLLDLFVCFMILMLRLSYAYDNIYEILVCLKTDCFLFATIYYYGYIMETICVLSIFWCRLHFLIVLDLITLLGSKHSLCCSDFLSVEQSPKHQSLCKDLADCLQNASVTMWAISKEHIMCSHPLFSTTKLGFSEWSQKTNTLATSLTFRDSSFWHC